MSYMTQATRRPRTHWEVAVLAFLREQPMHPYQMQRLLRERRKDELLALKRGSLYHAINRLTREGLIEPVGIGREGRRPERTTYRLTPAGADALLDSLRLMISTREREPSELFAALSFLVYLTPGDAAAQLAARAGQLETEIEALAARRRQLLPRLPRIHLLEEEYLLAMCRAERQWVRARLDEIGTGELTWDLTGTRDEASESLSTGARKRRRA